MYISIKNESMLSMRMSKYECTREVWRAREHCSFLSADVVVLEKMSLI